MECEERCYPTNCKTFPRRIASPLRITRNHEPLFIERCATGCRKQMTVWPAIFFCGTTDHLMSEYRKRCALIMEDNGEYCGKVVEGERKPDGRALLRMQVRWWKCSRFEVVEDPFNTNSEGFSTSLEGPMIPIKTRLKLTFVVCVYLWRNRKEPTPAHFTDPLSWNNTSNCSWTSSPHDGDSSIRVSFDPSGD